METEFAKYGIEDQLEVAKQVISCESGFQIDPKHNGISWGLAQFTKSTWKRLGYGDIMNPYSQIDVMAKMWKASGQGNWDCYCFDHRDNDQCVIRGF